MFFAYTRIGFPSDPVGRGFFSKFQNFLKLETSYALAKAMKRIVFGFNIVY